MSRRSSRYVSRFEGYVQPTFLLKFIHMVKFIMILVRYIFGNESSMQKECKDESGEDTQIYVPVNINIISRLSCSIFNAQDN